MADKTVRLICHSPNILAETWQTRFVPGFKGSRTGWWKSPKPNHYFDATYQAIVGALDARVRRSGNTHAADHARCGTDRARAVS